MAKELEQCPAANLIEMQALNEADTITEIMYLHMTTSPLNP
jgi:hypothetical protein